MTTHRKSKIVATLGPASAAPHILGPLIKAGLDVARLNCSHASHADLAYQVDTVRRVSRLVGKPVAILLDLSGPKVRTGTLVDTTMELVAGAALRVLPGTEPGQDDWISCNHAGLAEDVSAGDRILLDDGLMELTVTAVDADRVIHTEVVYGGTLKERKGMNLPDNTVSIPALTDKDKGDLEVGLQLGVDYVALSFVQRRQDILDLKAEMAKHGATAPIIAKIEKPQAVANIEEILLEVDGIMVARGDLAVEVGNEKVPTIQKDLLRRSNALGKLDIVATQMLESMTTSPRPTRAEASDVANAILDGCHAVMLSGETATGDYPIEAVGMMNKIAGEVEPWMDRLPHLMIRPPTEGDEALTHAIVEAAASIASSQRFTAIVVYTLSGRTARLLSGYYPDARILALSPNKVAVRTMALFRGVTPVLMPFPGNSDVMMVEGERLLKDLGLLQDGEEAVVVAGFTNLRGVANMMKIIRV